MPTGHPGQCAGIVVGDLSRDLSSQRQFASVDDIRSMWCGVCTCVVCACVFVCKAVSDWLWGQVQVGEVIRVPHF